MAAETTDPTALDRVNGFSKAMGFEFIKLSAEEVVVELDIAEQHLQPFGIVHGGVHCGIVEEICSRGAGLAVADRGQVVVGVENHTSFLRAVRSGRLRGVARPIQRGRRAHLWEATITDEQDRLVATGRVRLFCMDGETALAGKAPRPPQDR